MPPCQYLKIFSLSQKATHHQTYTKFLQYKKPQNYIFATYQYTSPFTMTNLYTLDPSKSAGNLRIYDPIKQYKCLIPHNDTSCSLIVAQEYLIHVDVFSLPCNIPTQQSNNSQFLSILWLRLSTTKTFHTKPHILHIQIAKMSPSLFQQTSFRSW